MVSDPLLVAVALGLVVVNAFFVAAGFARVRVRATRVEALAAEGHWQARLAATLHRRLDVFLSATQLGITLTSLGLGWIGEPAFAHLLAPAFGALGIESARVIENTSIAVAFATITFLHIVVGELAPKSFAIRFTERVALLVAPPSPHPTATTGAAWCTGSTASTAAPSCAPPRAGRRSSAASSSSPRDARSTRCGGTSSSAARTWPSWWTSTGAPPAW